MKFWNQIWGVHVTHDVIVVSYLLARDRFLSQAVRVRYQFQPAKRALMNAMAANSLESYRRKATFDVAALEILIDGEEVVEVRNQVWDTLATDPLFVPPNDELNMEQQQELNVRRMRRLVEYDFPASDSPMKQLGCLEAVQAFFDGSLLLLFGMNKGVSQCY